MGLQGILFYFIAALFYFILFYFTYAAGLNSTIASGATVNLNIK